MQLVLSLFPGIDLLGLAFKREGFCVVQGGDVIWGGDVRDERRSEMSQAATAKSQVLRVYPYAVCKLEPLKPWTRRSGLYFVHMDPDGPVIAGGPTAVLAWKFSLDKLKEVELRGK